MEADAQNKLDKGKNVRTSYKEMKSGGKTQGEVGRERQPRGEPAKEARPAPAPPCHSTCS